MTVKISSIDSIEIGHKDYRHFMVAELEFEDEEAVAKESETIP